MKSMHSRLLPVLLLFSFSISFFIACKKDGTGETPTPTTPIGNTLKSNSFIVSDNSFINLTDNSVTIIKASASISPKVGDILLAQPSQNAPYGFLRKVTNITETATQAVCTTEQAGLNEAFEQLDIDTTYTDKFTSTTAYKDGASMEFSFSNNGTLIPGMKLNGVLQLNMPSVKFEYVKKKNALMPEKVVFLTEINTEGSNLEILHADNVAIQFSEQTLKTISLPTIKVIIPITTPVGIFPLPVPFTQKLELRWKPLTISGKVKWEFKPILTATFGAKYENGNWENLSGFSFNGTADSLYQQFFPVNAGLNASFTFINPVYEISPYNSDALKVFVSIPHTLDFTLQPSAITPNYSLKYQAKITGGIKSKLWLGKENEYTISLNLPEKKLKEGNWVADDSLPIYKAAVTGNWTMQWEDPGSQVNNQIDKFRFNADGTGAYYWMKSAGAATGQDIAPSSQVYEILWSVRKVSNGIWYLDINYPNRGWFSTTRLFLEPAIHCGEPRTDGLYFLGTKD